jgi:hypothetical protein
MSRGGFGYVAVKDLDSIRIAAKDLCHNYCHKLIKPRSKNYTMSGCNNSSVPAVPEVISLISSDDDEEAKKKSAVPPVPAEVISLLSSDDESSDKHEHPQSMVGQVATYLTPPPHVAGLVQRDPPLHATGTVAGAIGNLDNYRIDPTETAEIELDRSGSGTAVMVLFTVQGKPSPLMTARFRFRKYGRAITAWNPSADLQASFLKAAKDALSFHAVPVFPDQSIYVRVVFWIRRPAFHFIASNRGPGRLKPQFQDQMAFLPRKSLDADNLAKFVLDALKGLLYTDDSQVVNLVSVKLHDNIGSCNGRTEVQVWRVRPEDLALITQSPYHLFR